MPDWMNANVVYLIIRWILIKISYGFQVRTFQKNNGQEEIVKRAKHNNSTEASKIEDEYRKYTFLDIDKNGCYIIIPEMGLEFMVPPGAVDDSIRLKVSILESFKYNATGKQRERIFLAPRVRIEPNDIKYRKPIYLSINHSLCLDETQSMDTKSRPMLLHRNHEDDEWTEVMNSKIPSLYAACDDKMAILTKNSIVIQMKTNCDLSLEELATDMGIRLIRILRLEAYADYQAEGSVLDIRVYGFSNLNHRAGEVERIETDKFGSHFIGATTTNIIDEKALDICVKVCFDRDEKEKMSKRDQITYDAIKMELKNSRGILPYKSFQFPTKSQDTASAPPKSVFISVETNQPDNQIATIEKIKDLINLHQREPKNLSSDITMAQPEDSARYREAKSLKVKLDRRFVQMNAVLKDELSGEEVEKLKSTLCVDDHYPNLGTLPYPQMKELVTDMVIKNRSPTEVLNFLEHSEVRNAEVRERFDGIV